MNKYLFQIKQHNNQQQRQSVYDQLYTSAISATLNIIIDELIIKMDDQGYISRTPLVYIILGSNMGYTSYYYETYYIWNTNHINLIFIRAKILQYHDHMKPLYLNAFLLPPTIYICHSSCCLKDLIAHQVKKYISDRKGEFINNFDEILRMRTVLL